MISLVWEEGCRPEYKTELSAGADVVTKEEIVCQPHKIALISTGVSIDCNSIYDCYQDLEIQLRLRSSLGKKGLIIPNGVGTIDLDYPGEIKLMIYNSTEEKILLKQFQRVAQLVLCPIALFTNIPISEEERGGGFGSTDIGKEPI